MKAPFIFSRHSELIRIPHESIIFIESEGNYSCLYTIHDKQELISMQLGNLHAYIEDFYDEEDSGFIRIGRKFIINRRYIYKINLTFSTLILSDGKTFKKSLEVSKPALVSLKKMLEEEELS